MTPWVMRVQELGKKYRLGGAEPLGYNIREALTQWTSSVFKTSSTPNTSSSYFWALQNVSFEVQAGDVVGVVGKNGAGKSTLLKILSRITTPTTGHIEYRGRMASLLEVGTGFHRDLTGRENIYMNGSILGMRRHEITKKLDQIIAFAEIEKFIDTPVKFYSSGMYVRLAFSVAAHLETDILLIDEVLAVGDSDFQKKCLGKMKEVATDGRTVLFVSHNMGAVLSLCNKALLLEKGGISLQGTPSQIIDQYLATKASSPSFIPVQNFSRKSVLREKAMYTGVEWKGNSETPWKINYAEPLKLSLHLNVKSPLKKMEVGVAIHSLAGFELISSLSSHVKATCDVSPGDYEVQVSFPYLRLTPGTYTLSMGIKSEEGFHDHLTEGLEFEVTVSDFSSLHRCHDIQGSLIPDASYTIKSSATHDCIASGNQMISL